MELGQHEVDGVELTVTAQKYQKDRSEQSDRRAAASKPKIRAPRKKPQRRVR
jgi:hypothetical protein